MLPGIPPYTKIKRKPLKTFGMLVKRKKRCEGQDIPMWLARIIRKPLPPLKNLLRVGWDTFPIESGSNTELHKN